MIIFQETYLYYNTAWFQYVLNSYKYNLPPGGEELPKTLPGLPKAGELPKVGAPPNDGELPKVGGEPNPPKNKKNFKVKLFTK